MATSVGTLHQEFGFTSVVIARFDPRTHFLGFDPNTELPASLDPRPAIFLHLSYLGHTVFVDFGEVNRRLSIAFFGGKNDQRGDIRKLLRSELVDSPFFEPASPQTRAAWREGEARIWASLVGGQPEEHRGLTEACLVAIRERLTLRDGGLSTGVPIGARAAETRARHAMQRFRSSR